MTLRLRLMLIFALHAVLVGGLFSRLAEVQRSLGLSEAAFGLVLTAVPLGGVVGTLLSPGLVRRLGTRRALLSGFILAGSTPVLVGTALGWLSLFAGIFAFGVMMAITSITSNVEADRVGLATGAPMIARSHGSWGLGFLLCSVLASLAIRGGVTPMQQFWVMFAVAVAAGSLLIAPLRESPERPHGRGGGGQRLAVPDSATWRVLSYALSGMVLEGITRNFSVIYLRDGFGAADWVAALALPAFVITQTLGRFVTDPLIARLGEVRFTRALSVVSLIGLAALAGTGSLWVALAACAVIGLGASASIPIATVALARGVMRPVAESVAAFAIVQSGVGLVAPVIYGWAAGAVDHRFALALMLPLPVLAWIRARRISG